MENPCDICLVKVNCTQVCPAKENFKTLLQQGIKNFQNNAIQTRRNVHLEEQYRRYNTLLSETYSDIWKIQNRKLGLTIQPDFNYCNEYFKQEYHMTFDDV